MSYTIIKYIRSKRYETDTHLGSLELTHTESIIMD